MGIHDIFLGIHVRHWDMCHHIGICDNASDHHTIKHITWTIYVHPPYAIGNFMAYSSIIYSLVHKTCGIYCIEEGVFTLWRWSHMPPFIIYLWHRWDMAYDVIINYLSLFDSFLWVFLQIISHFFILNNLQSYHFLDIYKVFRKCVFLPYVYPTKTQVMDFIFSN